jgi:hypothetical protein
VSYVSPEYAYAGFVDMEPSQLFLVLTYALIVAPVLNFNPRWEAPSTYGATLIYALCYIPIQLLIVFMWERPEAEMIWAQVLLCASMTVILRASTLGQSSRGAPYADAGISNEFGLSPPIIFLIHSLTIVATTILIVFYGRSMRLVAPEYIYDLRFETGQQNYGPFVNYPISWLIYVCLPFYYTRGILYNRLWDIAIGAVISLLLYAAAGFKIAALMGILIWGLNLMFGPPRTFLLRIFVVLGLLVMTLALIPSDDPDDPIRAVKGLVYVRVLGLGGWEAVKYYDFFTTNGLTYYSHIGPINAMTGDYPYGTLSLGQAIGLQYANSEEANFNASFWSSDGFAALGLAGIPVITIVLCGVWYMLNRGTGKIATRFVVLWLAGFWSTLLNTPLTTSLLSGGGLIVVSLLGLSYYLHRGGQTDVASESPGQELLA